MTTEDLRAIARRLLETLTGEHPEQAAAIASLVVMEILAIGLFDKDEAGVTTFAAAINTKLVEIALAVDAQSSWQLVRAERPRRH